jgi:hypothetical protein
MIRTLALRLAYALAVLIPAAPASADDLAALADRYVAWRGGAAFERLQNFEVEADLVGSGSAGSAAVWRDRNGRALESVELGVLKRSAGLAGDAWQTRNGVVEDMPAGVAEDLRRRTALEFAAGIRGGELRPSETREGRTWAVVRLRFAGPDAHDAFIDPAIGELHGFRYVENRRERFVELSDWRHVAGVRMPFRREETMVGGPDVMVQSVRKIALNTPAPAAQLKRPVGRKLATFAGGRAGTGAIGFNFVRGNRIYIPAKVNGHDVEVLLDSGAEMTVLDKAFAEALGLKAEGRAVASGTGGQSEASFARGVTIEIGAMQIANLDVGLIDLQGVSQALGTPLPVVLGADVFKQLIVDIDFEARTIAFHEPAAFKPPPGAVTVPVVQGSDGIRTAPVSIEGGPPVQVDFDIGNGSPFIVSAAYWEPNRLLEGRPSTKVLSGAVGGMHEKPLAVLSTVTFGGVDFKNVPTVFDKSDASALSGDRSVGNIGLPMLSRFRMMTDYPNNRLHLIPLRDAQRPFPKNRAGVRAVGSGQEARVAYVSPGSPGEAAGVKAGDVIRLVNGRPAAEATGWETGDAGQAVTLTLADGATRSLTLKDYF